MREAAPQTVYLRDYTPPPYLVDHVTLEVALHPTATRVRSTIRFRRNPATGPGHPLRLDGEELTLIAAQVDGVDINAEPDDLGLSIPSHLLPDTPFVWEAEVEINPQANTTLDGLYMSNGMYSTQCEAEGFRKITFYPDRPDVMAPFKVRVTSDLPVMLSNGNPVASGPGWAEWEDPHPKPSYLFALVAGDLQPTRDTFSTMEGRHVDLGIWVRAGDSDKTAYAMDALKRSMLWDEAVYGRAYDLDVFNIVAVDDFNMGAMENKGLNIFNSRCVLASPATATDADYASIERIIAHEYFHNWTGNRITCRDWFQLSLKEGLTVFRDQQFMGDMRSHAVKRIGDVLSLRARQFREDAGPLAHAVRPEAYAEINNFYTATIYEKGAEVIRMLRLLVGPDAYAAALDLYFSRHDGQACTIDDWLSVFSDATGRDLSQFKRWYGQAGTPHISVTEDWVPGADAAAPGGVTITDTTTSNAEAPAGMGGTYTLTLRQDTPATPGQPLKEPLVIPVALGLIGPDGTDLLPTVVLELTGPEQVFRFGNLPARPVPSILRDFSAPVILSRDTTDAERALLLAHDTDPVTRWEAGRDLARAGLERMILNGAGPDAGYIDALGKMLRDATLDPAFRALTLGLPSQDDMAQGLFTAGHTPDPDAIHRATQGLRRAIATVLHDDLAQVYDGMSTPGAYDPGAVPAGKRALRLGALAHLTRLDDGARARALFTSADNMTEAMGAWTALLTVGLGVEETQRFYTRWQAERLVIDKWFAAQVACAAPDRAVAVATDLSQHADFNWKNPNRFRAVFGALSGNAAGFHQASGAGYALLADWLIQLDAANPQTAARMSSAFETWRRYDPARRAAMTAALERMLAHPGLSRDMTEMVSRMRG
ncbi:aminopeptidase N [Roseicitreum antarcticum]|uniref:Aminopeptidase N n=1 Tax=Roseicitreum antarcticum TaxID=564137 RepID=A0A1H2UCK8_9RHOB|nr:aminopeptidase N [Roseicitreum antarcticum]SDW53184.1 aminopeptidase N [Roseicitreum antarcticum]